MNVGPISIDLASDTSGFGQEFEKLRAWLAERPDEAGNVEHLLFCDGKIRPGMVRIDQLPTSRAGEIWMRIDFSDQGRELIAALMAGTIDWQVVEELSQQCEGRES